MVMDGRVAQLMFVAIAAAAVGAAAVWVFRKGWHRALLSDREVVTAAKLLFVIVSVMFLIVLHNAIDLPAGQFIYGRF